MNTKQENYVLIKKESRYSKNNGGNYYLITFLDPVTGNLLETSIDPDYENYRNWRDIVQHLKPEGIYTNLSAIKKYAKSGNQIISADSHPQLVEHLTLDEVTLLLEAVLESITGR